MRVVVVPVVVSLLVPGAVSTAEAPRGYRLIIQTSLRGAEQVFCAMRPRVSTLRHRRRPCHPPPRRPARAPFVPARAPGATPPPAAAMPQWRLVFGGREMGRLISQLTCEAPERLLELAGGQCCRRCCNSQSRTGAFAGPPSRGPSSRGPTRRAVMLLRSMGSYRFVTS